MKLYIFKCRTRPKMYGATLYETASNLPTKDCSQGWKFFQRVDLSAHGALRFAVDKTLLRRQVQMNGWFVWDESPRELRRPAAEPAALEAGGTRPATKPSAVSGPDTSAPFTDGAPNEMIMPEAAQVAALPEEPVTAQEETVVLAASPKEPVKPAALPEPPVEPVRRAPPAPVETVVAARILDLPKPPAREPVPPVAPREPVVQTPAARFESPVTPPVRPVEPPAIETPRRPAYAEIRERFAEAVNAPPMAPPAPPPVSPAKPANREERFQWDVARPAASAPLDVPPRPAPAPGPARPTFEPTPERPSLATALDKQGVRERTSEETQPPRMMEEIPQADRRTRNITEAPARHHVMWFDIPVRDIDRAIRFYSAVLGIRLKKEQAGPGAAVALLPHAEGFIGGCLVQNMDARPSESGPLIYLNAQGRLDEALHLVEMHGGKVVTSRHSIEPFGFRAVVVDSEGNRIALHTM